MLNKFYFVIFLFFGTICFTDCLPVPLSSHKDRLRRAFIYGVNGIEQDDTKNNTSSEEVPEILLIDETESNPWNTFLSLRNAFPPSNAGRNRERFAHFYKNKSLSNIDPIVFPTISADESPTLIYDKEAVTPSSTTDVSSDNTKKLDYSEDDDSSSSQSSSTETEAISETENSKISMDILSTWPWLWENMTPSTPAQFTVKPGESDIDTHSLYHGPKINKRKLGKIECPPGQRPNHFGECKRPITLKQSDYD